MKREHFFRENSSNITKEEFLAARKAAETIALEKKQKEEKEAEERRKAIELRKQVGEYFKREKEKGKIHVITNQDISEAEKFTKQKLSEKNNN